MRPILAALAALLLVATVVLAAPAPTPAGAVPRATLTPAPPIPTAPPGAYREPDLTPVAYPGPAEGAPKADLPAHLVYVPLVAHSAGGDVAAPAGGDGPVAYTCGVNYWLIRFGSDPPELLPCP